MKNVIITGANSGLGYETVKKVAADHSYKVILACRNMKKAEATKDKIITETGNENVAAIFLYIVNPEISTSKINPFGI